MKKPVWDVKVTSKGQITLPKEIRDLMVVREGDHLQAEISNDAIMLTRKEELPENEQIRLYMTRQLRDSGVDPATAGDELRAAQVRKRIPAIPIDMAARIRSQREGRDDVLY
ncbi:MAG: AbrB/MazE/SpoVT family DNA-binding domain-containing protein [Bacillota bacterium]|nr:AbrB/MazE/SpoVT family DNA-binding domain-containing protein [Bacillota bacterium]